jgi:hypothetical protein
LHDAIGYHGQPVVRIGDVVPSVADRLAAALINGSQSEEVVDRY